MFKHIHEELGTVIKHILDGGRLARVSLAETIMPMPSNEYRHNFSYFVNGQEKGKDSPSTDDDEPVARGYATALINDLKDNLRDIVIIGPKTNKSGDKATFSVQYADHFEVPAKQIFTDLQASNLLGMSLSELEQYIDPKVEMGEVKGYRVNEIAIKTKVSSRILAERYQNLFKEK